MSPYPPLSLSHPPSLSPSLSLSLSLSLSGTFAPLLAEEARAQLVPRYPPSPLVRNKGGWTTETERKTIPKEDFREGGKQKAKPFLLFFDRMNDSFLNMASIGDFDPLNASIPATKVEITVSCR